MTKDEALALLEESLDQAASQGRPVVWIVHGHGTGVLKQAVRDYLVQTAYVHHFRPGARREGGDGVTLAWID